MTDKRIFILDIMTTMLLWKMKHIVVLHSDAFFFFFFELHCHLQMFKKLQFGPQNHKSVCKMINVEIFYFASWILSC